MWVYLPMSPAKQFFHLWGQGMQMCKILGQIYRVGQTLTFRVAKRLTLERFNPDVQAESI